MQGSRDVAVKLIRATSGVVLLLVGIVGLFMPVLPGWLLIIPGLALLARDFAWAERVHVSVKERFHRARQMFDGGESDTVAERDAA